MSPASGNGCDWANSKANCYACEQCGYVHWFVPVRAIDTVTEDTALAAEIEDLRLRLGEWVGDSSAPEEGSDAAMLLEALCGAAPEVYLPRFEALFSKSASSSFAQPASTSCVWSATAFSSVSLYAAKLSSVQC